MASWQDEITSVERQGKIRELTALVRRLSILKEQRAAQGRSADPYILIQIEDITPEVSKLKQELGASDSQVRSPGQLTPDLFGMFADIETLLHELKQMVEQGQIADKEASNRILEAVQQGRVEQGDIAETVESLRRWAKSAQETGLPVDPELRATILKMTRPTQGLDGMYNYLHFTLPLLPLLFNVESEIDLNKLWKEIKERWGSHGGSA